VGDLFADLPCGEFLTNREKVIVATWVWGSKYGPEYVELLAAGVARNLAQAYDFCVFSPSEEDEHLTTIPGCFARLRLFDPAWQERNGFKPGDRILNLDLDLIVTGSLDHLFDDDAPFRILTGVNAKNPCPYNGSVWRLTIGYRPDVWTDFSLEAAARVPHDKFPDDQAWFAHKMPGAAAYGPAEGVFALGKPGWPKGEHLPASARIVAFPGWRDPSKFQHLPWVKRHWLGEPVL
jgi:hypothetical protein